jgi:hypothetical protein
VWASSADGPVFTGLFRLRDTHGVPLVVVMSWLVRDGRLFSVPHFIRDAQKAGWSARKIRAELASAWTDLLPAKDRAECLSLTDQFLR